MTAEQVRAFALSFPEAVEDHPFGPHVDVYKVVGRIFLFLSEEDDGSFISLKCDPSLALVLRQQYQDVTPGYHLNKRHWNSVALTGDVPQDEIETMIHHSFEQVVAKLPKSERSRLT